MKGIDRSLYERHKGRCVIQISGMIAPGRFDWVSLWSEEHSLGYVTSEERYTGGYEQASIR